MNANAAPRILVAEDNRVLARILKFNLNQAGFDVEVVGDGRSAVERGEAESFDLIVVDYQMPRLCGEDVCRELRSGTRNTNTPFFFCTGKGYELDRDRIETELNIARFFTKPFSPYELIAAASETIRWGGDRRVALDSVSRPSDECQNHC